LLSFCQSFMGGISQRRENWRNDFENSEGRYLFPHEEKAYLEELIKEDSRVSALIARLGSRRIIFMKLRRHGLVDEDNEIIYQKSVRRTIESMSKLRKFFRDHLEIRGILEEDNRMKVILDMHIMVENPNEFHSIKEIAGVLGNEGMYAETQLYSIKRKIIDIIDTFHGKTAKRRKKWEENFDKSDGRYLFPEEERDYIRGLLTRYSNNLTKIAQYLSSKCKKEEKVVLEALLEKLLRLDFIDEMPSGFGPKKKKSAAKAPAPPAPATPVPTEPAEATAPPAPATPTPADKPAEAPVPLVSAIEEHLAQQVIERLKVAREFFQEHPDVRKILEEHEWMKAVFEYRIMVTDPVRLLSLKQIAQMLGYENLKSGEAVISHTQRKIIAVIDTFKGSPKQRKAKWKANFKKSEGKYLFPDEEKEYLIKLLIDNNGRLSRVSKQLGFSETPDTLIKKLLRYGLIDKNRRILIDIPSGSITDTRWTPRQMIDKLESVREFLLKHPEVRKFMEQDERMRAVLEHRIMVTDPKKLHTHRQIAEMLGLEGHGGVSTVSNTQKRIIAIVGTFEGALQRRLLYPLDVQ